MPLTKFKCPDGQEIPVEECLKGCRLKGAINQFTGEPYCPSGRCLSRRALQSIANTREWKGTPSTTQLLRSPCENYLEITTDYAIDPIQQVFALFGTQVHAQLEANTPEGGTSEVRLKDDVSSGQFDFIDAEGKPEGHVSLYDTKTYGSYVAAKVLRIQAHEKSNGTYKNGKPRKIKFFTRDGMFGHMDLPIQLSDYADKIEEKLGVKVDDINVEIIVRDGNTYIATSRGVTEPYYLVPIHRISTHWVKAFMKARAERLKKALDTGIVPPPCSYRDSWEGRKCESYCNVRDNCPYAQDMVKYKGKLAKMQEKGRKTNE